MWPAASETFDPFAHAYVLGGSPCCGKSSIAARLVAAYDLPYYKVDDHEAAHTARTDPLRQPTMARYAGMGWDAIWSRPVPVQVKEEFAYYRERFPLILADLRAYDPARPLLLEGAAYLPELVHAHHTDPGRVLFLVPTARFQVTHYRRRPWIREILASCAEPRQAFANWMFRDHLFGQAVRRQAQALGYRTIVVDGTQDLAQMTRAVAHAFGLARA